MKSAPNPAREVERLRALDAYGILDSAHEAQFDALTRVVAILLDVPMALVSIVDKDRQWFKSHYGLDVVETPRDVAFCAHTIHSELPMVVRDALEDERFFDNPLVVGAPKIRFYAGIPLVSHDGFALGTLCALDRRPRQLEDGQLEALALLAGQVVALLELRRLARLFRAEQQASAARAVALADQERRLEATLDSMVEGVVLQGRSGAVERHNRAAEVILGLSADELVGRTSTDPRWRTTHPDGTPFPGSEHPSMVVLRTGRPVSDVLMRFETPSGETRLLSVNARPLSESSGEQAYGVVSTFRDITEEQLTRERMAMHDRLVTTGTLAAGIGHEINNPLTYVLANLEMAIEELAALGGGSPPRRILEIIDWLQQSRDGAERVKRIVRGLKSLVRQEGEVGPLDVRGAVRSAIELANHELRLRATVTLELAEVPLVVADEAQLTQVLVNLFVNAGQAFAADAPAENQLIVRTSSAADGVFIDVIDNGPGIDPAVLPRIFDPFFTTKTPGVGTGLGLAISHRIVTSLGGDLSCDTEPGRGSTFRVKLPLAPTGVPDEPGGPGLRRGRVLVVDDEPMILSTLTRILGKEFDVVALGDPREALRRLEAGERFDVVFSDLLMPHLSGMALHEAVAKLDLEMADRFIFVGGDLMADVVRSFLERVPNERFEKPVSIKNVRSIARRFVGNRSGER